MLLLTPGNPDPTLRTSALMPLSKCCLVVCFFGCSHICQLPCVFIQIKITVDGEIKVLIIIIIIIPRAH